MARIQGGGAVVLLENDKIRCTSVFLKCRLPILQFSQVFGNSSRNPHEGQWEITLEEEGWGGE